MTLCREQRRPAGKKVPSQELLLLQRQKIDDQFTARLVAIILTTLQQGFGPFERFRDEFVEITRMHSE